MSAVCAREMFRTQFRIDMTASRIAGGDPLRPCHLFPVSTTLNRGSAASVGFSTAEMELILCKSYPGSIGSSELLRES